MNAIIKKVEKFFQKHYGIWMVGFFFTLIILAFYYIFQPMLDFPYISLSLLHLLLILTVELIVISALLRYYIDRGYNQVALYRSILGFLAFNLLFYQPFYRFYTHVERASIPHLQRIKPFLTFINIGLLIAVILLSILWRRTWWEMIDGMSNKWQGLRAQQRSGDVLSRIHRTSSWLDVKFPWLQTTWGERAIMLCKILVLWSVIIARTFSFSGFLENETDALPSALQFINRSWLPGDWYLNLSIGYRQAFNAILGPLVSLLGFEWGAVAGRLLVCLVFAIALMTLLRALRLRFPLGVIGVYVFLAHQSLVAAEWIVQGVDTKTMAYSFALMALAAFSQRRYFLGFLFAGLTTSFHMLIGMFTLFCIGFAYLLNNQMLVGAWKQLLKNSWIFILTGLLGLMAVVNQVFIELSHNTDKAWGIYVQYRVPFHVLPIWPHGTWKIVLIFAAILFLGIYLLAVSRIARFVAAFAVGSISLFAIGLLFDWLGMTLLLKYYWFRLPDVMVPMLGLILIAWLINRILSSKLSPASNAARVQKRVNDGVSVALVLVAVGISLFSLVKIWQGFNGFNPVRAWSKNPESPMLAWINANTPDDATFLVGPMMDNFYIEAERAMFVSFKHSPQSAPDIEEWYQRIILTNRNRVPERRGFLANKELTPNFYQLDPASILQIAESYGVAYYLGNDQRLLPFEQVHQIPGFILYRITPQ